MLGDKLKELRKEKGVNQQEVATYLQLSRQAYGLYENNKREPSYEVLSELAEYFNVSIDYLLGRTDIKDPSKEKELPKEFTTPEEAVDFLLNQNVIMGFGGFDIDKLDDDEKIEFANELLNQLQLLSYKYRK